MPIGVQPGADEVAAQPGRLADRGARSGVNDSGPQKNFRMPDLARDRHPGHRCLQERPHPVPVRRNLAEGEIARYAVDPPGCGARLEQADHEAAALLAVVAVGGGVLEDRPVGSTPGMGSVMR
jgi:hypothetical protein